MTLTLEEASRIADDAIAKANDLSIRISVAVCDAGGRLVARQRMNNAIRAGVYGSPGRTIACAAFGRASGVLSGCVHHPAPAGIAAVAGGHMIMGQGAVPILRDGSVEIRPDVTVEGPCGVGGGTAQQDDDCARAGAATL